MISILLVIVQQLEEVVLEALLDVCCLDGHRPEAAVSGRDASGYQGMEVRVKNSKNFRLYGWP